MATKSSKKTTTTTTITRESHAGSTPRTPRSPSPARISRLQEKESLQHLNDRLANYIDRVRHLEQENNRLLVQVRSCEETTQREVTNIKALYEAELRDARKLLDETSKEKAKLQIEVGKWKADAEDWMVKYNKKERELAAANKKLPELEKRVAELEAALAEAESKRKQAEGERSGLKAEIAKLQRQLDQAKKQLEEETLLRVDLENRVQSLKEELAFAGQVHAQELNETRSRTEIQLEEIDGRVQQEYENKLADALRDMRAQNDYQLRITREEMEVMYESRLSELQKKNDGAEALYSSVREELRISRKRGDEIQAEIGKLRNQNAILESRVAELESELARERDNSSLLLSAKQSEINRLQDEMAAQMKEYADLMDIKIALDTEIAAYRKLLEGEEERLNISAEQPEPTPQRTQVRSGKRKRVAVEEESSGISEFTQSMSSSGFAAQSSAKGGIEISDVDTDGKFVKLYNNSDKDVPLGSWVVKHMGGDQETTYKFHRTLNLKAGNTTTIWSADSEVDHKPPHDLVMKGQRWFIADNMKTVLLNNSGEEMATREMSRTTTRTVYQGRDVVDNSQLDEKKCVVM